MSIKMNGYQQVHFENNTEIYILSNGAYYHKQIFLHVGIYKTRTEQHAQKELFFTMISNIILH